MRALNVLALAGLLLASGSSIGVAQPAAAPATAVAVGPQYDTTHVYVAPADFEGLVAALVATFGGTTSKEGVFQVTPTPSQTMSQLVLTPVGTFSVFGFKTPVPYPFGAERTGYLVTDMDAAVAAARQDGADLVVSTFPDPIGRDAIVQWPGGVNMQIYWHTKAPNYAPLATVPENRLYVSKDRADAFISAFLAFSQGAVTSDSAAAPGVEIGRPTETYRRVRITSGFGKAVVLVTDGQLPWPYGRELTGYEVADLAATLRKAAAAGVSVLVPPYSADHRDAAIVQFPGGYIAEIHAPRAAVTPGFRVLILIGASVFAAGAWTEAVSAQDMAVPAADAPPTRPAIAFNRWQEDWSVLADPRTPREPFDELKYIPLSSTDPKVYLSFGADLRERFEGNDAPSFGVGPNRPTDYLISRLEVDADLHLGARVQVFTQLQSDFAPGKSVLTPVDQDRLDLEQAFVVVTEPLEGGTLKLRFGRQQFAFDLQRFISARDGPNVRQSYDAAWADYERGPWKFIGFYSQPVQDRDLRAFDDYSSDRLTYGGFRVERRLFQGAQLAIYYSRFTQEGVKFLSASGNERRDIGDVHFSGAVSGFDWDVEGMNQTGRIGSDSIEAWAIGSLAGYTLHDVFWTPRLGLQVDAASGDRDPHDHQLGTFNPLFPNGYYVTLAGYTGYVNFIHVKPSLTLHPSKRLKVMLAAAGQWRETTADAVYTQPDIPVAGTAGRPGRYTGTYGQLRLDWLASEHYTAAIEAVHFAIGDAIRAAGGHDADYVGVELKYGW